MTVATAVGGTCRPQRVFLSHTSELREHPEDCSFVAAAEAAVVHAGHAVTDMAYFAARDSEPADYCTAMVGRADVYVGIIGVRYGAQVPGPLEWSYTELEFEAASTRGIPRLIYLIHENSQSLPPTSQSAEHDDLQRAFRRRLQDGGVTVAWISSPSDLEIRLHQSLVELSAHIVAYVEGPQKPDLNAHLRALALAHQSPARRQLKAMLVAVILGAVILGGLARSVSDAMQLIPAITGTGTSQQSPAPSTPTVAQSRSSAPTLRPTHSPLRSPTPQISPQRVFASQPSPAPTRSPPWSLSPPILHCAQGWMGRSASYVDPSSHSTYVVEICVNWTTREVYAQGAGTNVYMQSINLVQCQSPRVKCSGVTSQSGPGNHVSTGTTLGGWGSQYLAEGLVNFNNTNASASVTTVLLGLPCRNTTCS
jgi:hypothetical protein